MSLFQENAPATDPAGEQKPPQAPNVADQLLAGIKNEEGKQKYSNVEEALKGLANAQEFISTLKKEKAELAASLKSQQQLEEMLLKPQTVEVPPPTVAPSGVTMDAVLLAIEQREAAKIASANIDKVKAALDLAFGAEAKKVLSERVNQLGLTPELADNMAAKSPEALLKLLDVSVKQNASHTSAVNTAGMTPLPYPAKEKFDPFKGTGSKTLEAWRESLKRTNARLGLE